MDAVYLAAFAVMAGLTLALLEFCDLLQKGDQP
jgi:hypothetical protein